MQFSGGNDFMNTVVPYTAGIYYDVCTGTGVQQIRRDYLDRPAIFGPDERGGALSIWLVTEMESFLILQPHLRWLQ